MQAATALLLVEAIMPSRGVEYVAKLFERMQPLPSTMQPLPNRLQSEFLRELYDDLMVPKGYDICHSRIRGVLVQYVQVWEASMQGLCRMLQVMDDNSTTSSSYIFTFVRSPISKFVSGFSELAFRASRRASNRTIHDGCNTLFDSRLPAASQAHIVLNDFVNGRVTQQCYGWDRLHLFPSVSFILAALRNGLVSHIDFIGRLERFSEDLRQLSLHLGAAIPGGIFDHLYHRGSDVKSSFPPRDEMFQLLEFPPTTQSKRQLCMFFLPDFACLNYSLPPECQVFASNAVISDVCSLVCPRLTTHEFDVKKCERTVAVVNLAYPQCALKPPWRNVDIIRIAGVNPIKAESTPGLWDFFQHCNRIYDEGLTCHNTSISIVADQLLSGRNIAYNHAAITSALFTRITGCFFELMRAEHFLAHPIATTALSHLSGPKYRSPRPAAISGVVLMYEFLLSASPFVGVAALYRVEDSAYDWGLSFEEWHDCLDNRGVPNLTQAIAAVAEKDCKKKLLLPGRSLTLTVHLTFDDNVSIWNWGTPEVHGFLRWYISPPHGHAHIVCGMPIAPMFAKDNFGRCGNSTYSYDDADAGMSRNEVVLLPGSRLFIEDVQWGTEPSAYTTVFARQYFP